MVVSPGRLLAEVPAWAAQRSVPPTTAEDPAEAAAALVAKGGGGKGKGGGNGKRPQGPLQTLVQNSSGYFVYGDHNHDHYHDHYNDADRDRVSPSNEPLE